MPVNTLPGTPVTNQTFSLSIVDINGNTTSVTTSDVSAGSQAAFRDAIGACTMGSVFATETRSSTKYISDPLTATVYEDAYSTISHVLTLIFSRYANSVRETTIVSIPAFDINLKTSPASNEIDVTDPRIVAITDLMALPANGGWSLARATVSVRQSKGVVTKVAPQNIVEPATGAVQEPPGENPLNP